MFCSSSVAPPRAPAPLRQRRCHQHQHQHHQRFASAPQPAAAAAEHEPSTSGSAAADAGEAAVRAAWVQLKAFTAAEFRGAAQAYLGSPAGRQKLRQALLLAYAQPWPEESWIPGLAPEVLLGVVASDARLAVRALRDWCGALQLEFVMPDCKVAGASSLAAVQGPAYIKYNATSKASYLSAYAGRDRGVLVQLGAGPLLGHFPLGLFDEAMANPAPQL